MTNQDKAIAYDDLLRESDTLQRANSKLKSQYVVNVPNDIQQIIDANNAKIQILVGKLENLMR
jgi:hypothetical protein